VPVLGPGVHFKEKLESQRVTGTNKEQAQVKRTVSFPPRRGVGEKEGDISDRGARQKRNWKSTVSHPSKQARKKKHCRKGR